MTQDERNMLTDLANKISQTPAPPKDAEAEEFIRTRIGNRPDALYLMTQTVLIQNLAIQHAQQQIQELQERCKQPTAGGASPFLGQQAASGRGFGGGSAQQYSPPPPQYAAQYAAPSPANPSPSAAPSFLRGAAQTAAGVAAGALAFEGIQALFSHPGYGGGFFGGGGGFMGGAPVEETVVNNYYDSPREDYRADDRVSDDASNVDDSSQYDDSGQDAQYDDASSTDFGDGGFDDNSGGDSFV
jgi:hypothetical protein